MAPELRTSEAGLKLIMAYEGFRSHSSQLPDGRWVIGYGHLRAARSGLQVNRDEAAAILREFDLPPIERGLLDLVLVPLNQNEFDALVSLVFNIGLDQFEKSEVLACLNGGDRMGAARAFELWRNARVGARDMVVDPLVRRRADEKALFLKTEGSVPLASSSRFRPFADAMPDEADGAPSTSFVVSRDSADSSRDDEIAPEAAARSVKERLTRILGEEDTAAPSGGDTDAPDLDDEQGQEASIEEIRSAVSALVSDDDEAEDEDTPQTGRDVPAETGPGGMDLLDETGDESMMPGRLQVEDSEAAARTDGLYVDDIDNDESDSAGLRRDRMREGPLELFVLTLIALAGGALFAFGGVLQFGWLDLDVPAAEAAPAYLAPILMLVGGLVFVVMAYYVFKALLRRGG